MRRFRPKKDKTQPGLESRFSDQGDYPRKGEAGSPPRRDSNPSEADGPIFTRYISEVCQKPVLSPQDELVVARRYKRTGNIEDRQRLIEANLRLVVKIAREYHSNNTNIKIMDLIQEGNIGLMKAVKKFDPARGHRLITYAAWWIRAHIFKYILDNFRLVKFGTTKAERTLFSQLGRAQEALRREGQAPDNAALAAKMGVTEDEMSEARARIAGNEFSLETPLGDDNVATYQDVLSDPGSLPDSIVARHEVAEIVREALGDLAPTLSDKELKILHERLLSDQPAKLKDLGDELGFSHEWARQIEKRVKKKVERELKGLSRDDVGTE